MSTHAFKNQIQVSNGSHDVFPFSYFFFFFFLSMPMSGIVAETTWLYVSTMIRSFRKPHSSPLTSKIRLYVLVHWAALADWTRQTQYSLWLELFLSPATSLDWLLMSRAECDENAFSCVREKREKSVRDVWRERVAVVWYSAIYSCNTLKGINVCPDRTKWIME